MVQTMAVLSPSMVDMLSHILAVSTSTSASTAISVEKTVAF